MGVAVLGVDNDELLCALSPPPLSIIRLTTPRAGWQAAALLGRTPREEIARVQLNRVKDLLAGTGLALAEIAGRAGFRHTEDLRVAFKRETGMTPGEYRKQYGSGG